MKTRFGPAAAKRLLLAGVALAALSLGVTTAVAQDDNHGTTTTRPVSWSIPAGQCSAFPAGATVSGEGTFTGFFEARMNHDGTITRIYRDHAEGTATDGDGNTYRFAYDAQRRRTAMIYPDGSQGKWTFDAAGQLIGYVTRAGQTKTTAYNASGQPLSDTWSPAGASPNAFSNPVHSSGVGSPARRLASGSQRWRRLWPAAL